MKPIKNLFSIVKSNCTAGSALAYSATTHKSSESVLADGYSLAHIMPRLYAAFSCVLSCCAFMVRLDGGVLVRASLLMSLSANSVQSNRLSLAAYDSTSTFSLGVNHD